MSYYTLFAILCLAFVTKTYGQIDLTFCDPDKLPAVNPPKPFFIPSIIGQYSMNSEVNDGSSQRTFEIDQWFDGLLNRAITITRYGDIETKIFNYDQTNEVIKVSGDFCVVSKANETDGVVQNIPINGTEHIINGLLLIHLLDPNFKEVYIGEGTERGIPCNKWQFCIFDPRSKATTKVTYAASNSDKWTIAVPVGNFTSTPVQLVMETKFQNATVVTDVISITKFRPGILTRDEFWVTPDGVWCPGRSRGKDTPKVPKAFRFRSMVVTPIPGLDDLIGDIDNIREEYDYDNKLVRLDYVKQNSPMLEIHDFNNGLRYIIDKFRGNCTLATIDPNGPDAVLDGTSIKIKNPYEFFDFENVEYQYVGQKHVSHVNCDVWIGRTTMFNLTVTKEWYFMADGWAQQGNLAIQVREPVLLIITFYRPFFNNQTQQLDYEKVPVYYYISDFDESGLTLFDFDIAACVDNYPKRHFLFNLPTDNMRLLEVNKGILYLSLLVGLETSIIVPRLRISKLTVDFNEDEIVVIFTLLEKAPQIGFNNNTKPEATLEQAAELLNATITSGKLLFPFPLDDNQAIDIQAIPDSLREFERGKGNYVYILKETLKSSGYSGGSVAGIAFGLLALGLLVGLIAGAFFCIYKPNLLPLDKIKRFSPIDSITGFANPEYKQTTSNA